MQHCCLPSSSVLKQRLRLIVLLVFIKALKNRYRNEKSARTDLNTINACFFIAYKKVMTNMLLLSMKFQVCVALALFGPKIKIRI